MPRAQQAPIVGIMRFFKTATTEECQMALALIKDELKDRDAIAAIPIAPVPPSQVRKKKRKLAKPPVNEASPIVHTPAVFGEQ